MTRMRGMIFFTSSSDSSLSWVEVSATSSRVRSSPASRAMATAVSSRSPGNHDHLMPASTDCP